MQARRGELVWGVDAHMMLRCMRIVPGRLGANGCVLGGRVDGGGRIPPFAFCVITIMPCVIVYFLCLDKSWESTEISRCSDRKNSG